MHEACTQCRTATVRGWIMTGRIDEQPTLIGIKDRRMEVQEESRRTEKKNRKLLQETPVRQLKLLNCINKLDFNWFWISKNSLSCC